MVLRTKPPNPSDGFEDETTKPSDVDTCPTSAKLDNSSSPAPDARVLMSGIGLDCSWAAAAAGMCLWTGDGDLRKTGLSGICRVINTSTWNIYILCEVNGFHSSNLQAEGEKRIALSNQIRREEEDTRLVEDAVHTSRG